MLCKHDIVIQNIHIPQHVWITQSRICVKHKPKSLYIEFDCNQSVNCSSFLVFYLHVYSNRWCRRPEHVTSVFLVQYKFPTWTHTKNKLTIIGSFLSASNIPSVHFTHIQVTMSYGKRKNSNPQKSKTLFHTMIVWVILLQNNLPSNIMEALHCLIDVARNGVTYGGYVWRTHLIIPNVLTKSYDHCNWVFWHCIRDPSVCPICTRNRAKNPPFVVQFHSKSGDGFLLNWYSRRRPRAWWTFMSNRSKNSTVRTTSTRKRLFSQWERLICKNVT